MNFKSHAQLGCLVATVSLSATQASAQSQRAGEPPLSTAPQAPMEQQAEPRDQPDPASESITTDDPAKSELPKEPQQQPEGSEAEPQEVQVLGSTASRAAGSMHVIREDQLERFEYDDPGQALLQTPGVYIRQEDGVGLRPNIALRGTNPDRSKKITLTEDGILFGPAPYSAPAAYFFPLLTRMTQIHVLKGPSAIAHGPQTVGGAIDFISRPIPTTTSGQVDLGVGEHGYFKGHTFFGTSSERFGFLVEGVRLQNTGFTQLPGGADTGSTRNEWMMKAAYLVDPHAETQNEFQFKFVYSDEVSNETYLGQSDADFREDPYRRYPASALDQMKNHRASLSLTHLLGVAATGVQLKTTVYRNTYRRSWSKLNRMGGASVASVLQNPDDPSNQGYYGVLRGEVDSGSPAEYLWIGPNDRSFISQGVQSVFTAPLSTGPLHHQVETGLRVHNDSIRRRHSEDAYAMVGGELIAQSEGTLLTTFNRASTYAVAAHVTDAISYGPLTVTPGIRAEFIWSSLENYLAEEEPANGFVLALMPGAGVYYELIRGLGILGGVYRGFSPPPPGSTDNVDPEYSVNYEAGARYSAGRTRLESIGFYNDYQNLTDICTLASGCLDENLDRQFDAGRARVYGVEVFGSHEVRLPYGLKLPVSVAYTFSRGEFLSSFQSQDPIYGNVSRRDRLPYLPPHQFNGTLALEHRFAGINVSVNYAARMREVAGIGEILDSLATDEQFWMDLGVVGHPLPWLTLYGNVRNLSAEKNLVARRPYGARANAPRWIQLGAKAEF